MTENINFSLGMCLYQYFKDLETNQDWNLCIDDNGATLGRCVYACNGNLDCEIDCLDSFKSRQANCPCEENCISGCPCEEYDCVETTTSPEVPQTTTVPIRNAVLVLSTYQYSNKPMVVDFEGKNRQMIKKLIAIQEI